MKSSSISMVAVLVTVTMIGSILATTTLLQQQASGLVIGSGKDFKKLTSALEKAVLDAAAMGDTDMISRLLDQYVMDVKALDLSPR